MKCNLYFNIFAGPPLPYRLADSAMATSPDGGGVILFGGRNLDYSTYYNNGGSELLYEDDLLELRFGADNWTILPQKLKQPIKYGYVVIPIS